MRRVRCCRRVHGGGPNLVKLAPSGVKSHVTCHVLGAWQKMISLPPSVSDFVIRGRAAFFLHISKEKIVHRGLCTWLYVSGPPTCSGQHVSLWVFDPFFKIRISYVVAVVDSSDSDKVRKCYREVERIWTWLSLEFRPWIGQRTVCARCLRMRSLESTPGTSRVRNGC